MHPRLTTSAATTRHELLSPLSRIVATAYCCLKQVVTLPCWGAFLIQQPRGPFNNFKPGHLTLLLKTLPHSFPAQQEKSDPYRGLQTLQALNPAPPLTSLTPYPVTLPLSLPDQVTQVLAVPKALGTRLASGSLHLLSPIPRYLRGLPFTLFRCPAQETLSERPPRPHYCSLHPCTQESRKSGT